MNWTSGSLFLWNHLEKVRNHPRLQTQRHFWEPNSPRWVVLYLPQEFGIHPPPYHDLYQDLSQSAPLLRFTDEQDYGWAYQIYDAGQVVAECYKHYVLMTGLSGLYSANPDYFADLSSEERTKRFRTEEELERMLSRTQAYREEIEKQYRNSHVEAFQRFGVDAPTIQAIDALLLHPTLDFSVASSWEDEDLLQSLWKPQLLPALKYPHTLLNHILRLMGVDTDLLWKFEDVAEWRQEGEPYNPMGDAI